MKLPNINRLLSEVSLEPVQGSRFQPTGFPSLGSAEFTRPTDDGNVESLLVESAQSMANRLEDVCWDSANQKLVDTLNGIPIITVNDGKGEFLTNSLLESHRINSSYIIKHNKIVDLLKEIEPEGKLGSPDMRKLARFALKYDPNTILHGMFLSLFGGGRLKMTRCISAFIEATHVKQVVSGGVKMDILDPKGSDGGSQEGFGHIPYSRTEYSAHSIKAYFNIDLARVRSYGLSDAANEFLFTFALWKIQSFLKTGLRLRTACDFKIKDTLTVTYPGSFSIPDLGKLDADLKQLIKKCKDNNEFVDSPLVIQYVKSKKKNK